MSQLMGITLTFKRDNLMPRNYLFDIQEEDRITIMNFYKCWSLAAQIEDFAREYGLLHEDSIYVANNLKFLERVYFILKDEYNLVQESLKTNNEFLVEKIYTPLTMQEYSAYLKDNMKNLEWLLFYFSGRIALSQLFEKLPEKCFSLDSSRAPWTAMCKHWGNKKPEDFEVLFWIL